MHVCAIRGNVRALMRSTSQNFSWCYVVNFFIKFKQSYLLYWRIKMLGQLLQNTNSGLILQKKISFNTVKSA